MAQSSSTSRQRRGRRLRLVAAGLVLLGTAGYLAVQHLTPGDEGPPRCTVRAGGDGGPVYEVPPEQASNASTIEAVASARGLPERAVTIAVATAMQESGLRNIAHGDRDSLGLFQQRPSQGWGTPRQILDPVYAAGKFYDHLVRIPRYADLPLTVAAQKVQRSGYPRAYAKHEANAALLSAALTGRRAAALTCTTDQPTGRPPGDLAAVRERLAREFGPGVLSGSRSGSGGPATGTAEPRGDAGRSLTLPVRSGPRGWELAHWALAHAAELRVAEISYGGRTWRAEGSRSDWRTSDQAAGGSAVVLRLAPPR